MHEATTQKTTAHSGANLKRQIRLLDGRIKNISIDKPFAIKDDSNTLSWDLGWLITRNVWSDLLLENLLDLLRTHSIGYAYSVAFNSKALFNRPLFLEKHQLDLESIARAPELITMTYWPFLQPLLKRMAIQDEDGALSDDLKSFLKQPTKWETKVRGAYFALVANDPIHGAFTEQELFSIQEGVNLSYEKHRISLAEYALVWFLIGTGVRPVQIARMNAEDVKIYDGPEGKEVTLYIPLAKGEGSPNLDKWRRRCPTILAEILIKYIEHYRLKNQQTLFKDQSRKIRNELRKTFRKVTTYSKRTDTSIHIFPYRFRYTLGTRAIALGASDQEVARLLTHRRTYCVKAYRAAMPQLQNPIKEALSSEMRLIASVFQGKLINGLDDATRKGQVEAIIRDFIHLNGEAIGACGTEADCSQHAPRACLMCRKFEPFRDAPWDELLAELKSDMDEEQEDKIKLITLPFIEAVKDIKKSVKKLGGNNL